jgi:predicted P-loop ATPase
VSPYLIGLAGALKGYLTTCRMNISYFKSAFETKPTDTLIFSDFLAGIKHGKWQDIVINYRNNKIKKELLPCVTSSGVFDHRSYKGLKEHSGILNIDIDQKQNIGINLIDTRDQLYADPFVLGGHISVGGNGLSLYVKINSKKHYESFCALEKYFANKYEIIIDKGTKDVPRARFISYDPEAFINEKSKKWDSYIEKQKQPPKSYGEYVSSKSDFEFVMQQITRNAINITEDYHDWVKVGFAIASEFGDRGRQYFHDVSKVSSKYDFEKCEKKYDNILKSNVSNVKISSFFWMAKNAGIEIKSQRTKKIESAAKLRLKQVGNNGGSANVEEARRETEKYLREVEGITGGDVTEIIDQLQELNPRELNEKPDLQKKIEYCLQIINQHGVKFNVITGKLESNGEQLTDNDVNSIYIDLIEVEPSIKRDLFNTIINSNRIRKFDPFKDFIAKHKHLKPSGCIDELLKCIDDRMFIGQYHLGDYKEIFVKKWLLSIMASIHGTYSLMILVLTGKQMIEKTNFFRNLLPDELRSYYAESKLDAGKDDEILMTQKILLIDDEFGGKSKQEAKKLKDLSSKQYFSIRRPYARYAEDIRRIAVLGGTSNDDEILNDPTGNRRIIPLKIESIDMERYKEIDKTELFIELYHEWKKIGDGWMLTPEEVMMLNESTLAHEQEVTEYQLLEKYYEQDSSYFFKVTSTDIKVFLEAKTGQRLSLYKIGQSLRKLGYDRRCSRQGVKIVQIWNVKQIVTDESNF